MSYSGVAYDLQPGDYLIILHKIDYKPDLVYTISSLSITNQSSITLSGSISNNGDWYYDNNVSTFSYIGNHFLLSFFLYFDDYLFF